ncbi:MAG: pyridoxamine 5'-phosphate oxidase family protein [Phycisphaeraceae bacterium]
MPDTLFNLDLPPAIARQVLAFLQHARTASLATIADDATPHAANVQFASDAELNFYWVSSPASVHSRHIDARPATAMTIYGHDDRALNIHGLQMHGRAAVVASEVDRDHAWNAFVDKFADLANNPRFREMIGAQQFYCFRPTWLRWIDNRRGFGFKVESQVI